jgi:hypothetical protein
VSEPKTLLLTETGVESLPDGKSAVNVGPIVRALGFLTEGRGEDRGTDEHGQPLPDLMSLAFDVIEAIILGGRKADYFRQVKRDLEAQNEGSFRSSLALAKQARRVHATAPATSLDHAADALQALLGELSGLSLGAAAKQELEQALQSCRAFGADRWVSATAQLLVAVNALGAARPAAVDVPARRPRRRKPAAKPAVVAEASPKRKAASKRKASRKPAPKAAPKAKAPSKPKTSKPKTSKPGKKRKNRKA